MPELVQFETWHKRRRNKLGSFPKFIAIAMIASFSVGSAVPIFISGDKSAIAQALVSSKFIIAGKRENLPATKQVSFTAAKQTALYQRCAGSRRVNCIVDGDTLWSQGVKIRIADIDTPEISHPRCAAEKALGERATVRLMDLVNAAPFDLLAWHGRDHDKYGRKLRVLVRNGRSLGDILVSEGLARTWTGKRQPWC